MTKSISIKASNYRASKLLLLATLIASSSAFSAEISSGATPDIDTSKDLAEYVDEQQREIDRLNKELSELLQQHQQKVDDLARRLESLENQAFIKSDDSLKDDMPEAKVDETDASVITSTTSNTTEPQQPEQQPAEQRQQPAKPQKAQLIADSQSLASDNPLPNGQASATNDATSATQPASPVVKNQLKISPLRIKKVTVNKAPASNVPASKASINKAPINKSSINKDSTNKAPVAKVSQAKPVTDALSAKKQQADNVADNVSDNVTADKPTTSKVTSKVDTKAKKSPKKTAKTPAKDVSNNPPKTAKTGLGSQEITIEQIDTSKYDMPDAVSVSNHRSIIKPSKVTHTAKLNNQTIKSISKRHSKKDTTKKTVENSVEQAKKQPVVEGTTTASQPNNTKTVTMPSRLTATSKPSKKSSVTTPPTTEQLKASTQAQKQPNGKSDAKANTDAKSNSNSNSEKPTKANINIKNSSKNSAKNNIKTNVNNHQKGENGANIYLKALQAFSDDNTDEAIKNLQAYVADYPQGTLIAKAHYWLGESYLQKEPANYAAARFEFLEVVNGYQNHPNNDKHVKALYRLSQLSKINNYDDDLKMYTNILKNKYPDTEETQLALKLLKK